ncbi:MAG: UDP-N-acetylglucosamine 2-epimerase (non-hydrolyzing) [Coriobacteriia bacterium]|nr:UDP-N-acetylglucosamine 2-epimerase (non-hydrolyzing) [Coriobacteriia bacterium]
MPKQKVITLLGTRPEIIRLRQVIEILDASCNHVLVHTGQNFDERLSQVFFDELSLRKPDIYLGMQGNGFGEQVGDLLGKVETLFRKEQPDTVLILGDTNTGIAAYVAKRMGIRVCHMEAGNRCFDDTVPEEVNRRVIDHCSSVLMPYTYRSAENLVREGVERQRIFVTGNPIKEVLDTFAAQIEASTALDDLNLESGKYFLATAHRAETTDVPERLDALIQTFNAVIETYDMPLVASLHPRTADKMKQQGLDSGKIRFVPPLGFFDFVRLEKEAFCVLSDSGTVQEECCIFGVPTVTLRSVTERPETIECGSNILSDVYADRVLPAIEIVTSSSNAWTPPLEYLTPNIAETVARIVLGITPGR